MAGIPNEVKFSTFAGFCDELNIFSGSGMCADSTRIHCAHHGRPAADAQCVSARSPSTTCSGPRIDLLRSIRSNHNIQTVAATPELIGVVPQQQVQKTSYSRTVNPQSGNITYHASFTTSPSPQSMARKLGSPGQGGEALHLMPAGIHSLTTPPASCPLKSQTRNAAYVTQVAAAGVVVIPEQENSSEAPSSTEPMGSQQQQGYYNHIRSAYRTARDKRRNVDKEAIRVTNFNED
ncbi:hypothetical protein DV737_g461, partial [Chaetothyriales sp. CBS 132003]